MPFEAGFCIFYQLPLWLIVKNSLFADWEMAGTPDVVVGEVVAKNIYLDMRTLAFD
jgi:hypothetical protein